MKKKILNMYESIKKRREIFCYNCWCNRIWETVLFLETVNEIKRTNAEVRADNFVKILVDDLVENDVLYKKEVREIVDHVLVNCRGNNNLPVSIDDPCVQNAFDNPDEILRGKFEKAYWRSRTGKSSNKLLLEPLNNENYTHQQNPIQTFNSINDDNLKAALEQNKNIVLEYTGKTLPYWLFEGEFKIPHNYKVIFSYSLVNIPKLVTRNKKRAYMSMKHFYSNKTQKVPAFRLPDVSQKVFTSLVAQMQQTLFDLYDAYQTKDDKLRIDQILVFDNNKDTQKSESGFIKIFDSEEGVLTKRQFKRRINKSINSNISNAKNTLPNSNYLSEFKKWLEKQTPPNGHHYKVPTAFQYQPQSLRFVNGRRFRTKAFHTDH